MNAEDFNRWRSDYPWLTYDQMRQFYDRLALDHPEQDHFCPEAVLEFFRGLPGSMNVVELGGWDGALARLVLAETDRVATWINYEISHLAVRKTVCEDPRYIVADTDRYLWEQGSAFGDVFVGSHVIEHLSPGHFSELLDWLDSTTYVYIDLPDTTLLQDQTAAHMLGMSAKQVAQRFTDRGYRLVKERKGKVDSIVMWFRYDP